MPNERMDEPLRSELLLSLQRALVGAVPASLRAVTCDWAERKIVVRCIFDRTVDPGDADDMAVVGAEVISDFPPHMALDEQVVRVDHPVSLAPHFLRAWAYMRKEGPTEDRHRRLFAAGGA